MTIPRNTGVLGDSGLYAGTGKFGTVRLKGWCFAQELLSRTAARNEKVKNIAGEPDCGGLEATARRPTSRTLGRREDD